MTTAVLDLESGVTNGKATVRYFGILTALAEADTIGITLEADVLLHAVPAGGQSLYEALQALAVLGMAAGYAVIISKNSEFDQCLHASGGTAGGSVTAATPVYVVA
jgi:hypothetical protein